MAVITHIEIANLLSEGFGAGGQSEATQWSPLYRGVTMSLRGQSTAVQINNGDGKSSITQACLYLLSRDARLKDNVMSLCAPAEKGWTHVRIEFGEKTPGENILQTDLITREADEFPGIPYVIGMCWNRDGSDPHFYLYQGWLADAPVYEKTEGGLNLISNETFRNSVEKIKGSKWNKWGRNQDWQEEIKFFMDVAMVRQNVDFQLKGAGDASTMLKEIKPEDDETFDEAFFRQAIAPELLKDAMGSEADTKGDTYFEDTLLRSLMAAANSTTEIAKSQIQLDQAENALQQFEPVLEKAHAVIRTNDVFEQELDTVVKDAAILHILAERHPIPAVPQIPSSPVWRKDKRILQALSHMFIDKREGALITDEGLAKLCGLEVSRLNDYAQRNKIKSFTALSQIIDLSRDFKAFRLDMTADKETTDDPQVIDLYRDLKKDGRGGRRSPLTGYNLWTAQELIQTLANLKDAKLDGVEDLLSRSFGIAASEIDSNPYRKARNKLVIEVTALTGKQQKAAEENKEWQEKVESLLSEQREAKEDETAFVDFAKRKSEFLQDHWDDPIAAKQWARSESSDMLKMLENHISKVGTLSGGFEQWKMLTKHHVPLTIGEAHSDLVASHSSATASKELADKTLSEAKAKQRSLQIDQLEKSNVLDVVKKSTAEFERLRSSLPLYEQLFGNSDPDMFDPRTEVKNCTKDREEKRLALNNATILKSELTELVPMVEVFHKYFSDADPSLLDPAKVDRGHRAKISVEETNISLLLESVESLHLFRERHPLLTPEQWINETAKQRIKLHTEKRQIDTDVAEWRTDLSNLEKFGAADNRVYAQALFSLDAAKIPYERLNSVIKATSDGARRTSLLTLFSSALSAPVLKNIEDAQIATKLLEQKQLTVPVFLSAPLLHFVSDSEVVNVDDLSHTFLVGRRTRQVDILLNPDLITEEKTQINLKIDDYLKRRVEIESELTTIAEGGELYAEAMRAKTALSRNAEANLTKAQDELAKLNFALKDIEKKASPEALSSIIAAKAFNKKGGKQTLQTLTQKTVPLLEIDIKKINEKIVVLEKQSSNEALRALDDIREFKAAGGEEKYANLKHQIYLLEPVVEMLTATLADLKQKIDCELEVAMTSASSQLATLLQSYSHEKFELEKAMEFEGIGHHIFMNGAEEQLQKLQTALANAQQRLQDIDFERAARYLLSNMADRNVADLLAHAKAKKLETSRIMEDARERIVDINGQISKLAPFVENLHELAFNIRDKATKLESFSDDIRLRMRSEMGTHPDLQKYAEEIRFACISESPGTSDSISAAIANLHASISSLTVDTKHLGALKQSQRNAQREFSEKRADFCAKARHKEITGLHELEIAKIESANTIEELTEIQSLRDLISNTIEERNADLQKTKELAHASKNASIKNMTDFARVAERNLDFLDRVMKKSPKARFFIESKVADEVHIRSVVESLLADIEDRERVTGERANAPTNTELERKKRGYRELIKEVVYKQIFINPKVEFSHTGIWNGDRRPFNDILSMGQKTALHLMWLIKHAEYSLLRASYQHRSRKERDAALRNSQHILFFDGLFSNLSNEKIINEAFEGLKYVGDAFQLIGLIHNTRYVNNKDIFPAHLIGRRYQKAGEDNGARGFVTVEPWQTPGDMGMFTSIFKRNTGDSEMQPIVE
ncbi:hypothetical protein [Undibacterium sp. Ji49W]|uniref:hypothetical protein n=1 Tax=Undibacterium sp. Ji49W TaxID=3413040 RepID=UPI003BEFB2F1